jgi:hypothetical protein
VPLILIEFGPMVSEKKLNVKMFTDRWMTDNRYSESSLELSAQGPVSLKTLRLRPEFNYVHYFLVYIALKMILILFKENRKMFLCQEFQTDQIISPAKFYYQLRFLVVVVSSFVTNRP